MKKQTLYRVYTENKNLKDIKNLTKFCFLGATIYTGTGFYDGNEEECIIIEVVETAPFFENRVVRFAEAIKKSNKQTSVLITRSEIEAEYV